MNSIKTWQQAVEYTFKTRHEWRHGNGAKTSRINCNHFTRLQGGSFPIKRITQPIVNGVCIELEDEGKSDATINRIVSAVSTVLNHCAFDGLIDTVPKLRRRKESEGRVIWYTKDQVKRLTNLSIDVFNRQDLAEIIDFAAYTGMRQGEILKIREKDFDLGHNLIHVGGVPTQITKSKNWRAIPIHEHLTDAIHRRCKDASRSDTRLFGQDWQDKDQLYRAFKKVRKHAGIDEKYCFHTLRHSFATWNAEANVPIRTIMALGGWKDIDTVLRYAKATDASLVSAISAI